jgi:hypothetical protein
LYGYPLNAIRKIDPLGLSSLYVYTDMTDGKTHYFDPESSESYVFDSRNQVAGNSLPGAADPYSKDITGCEIRTTGVNSADDNKYGAAIIHTADPRVRFLHGGGSGLPDPLASRQGWKPTLGCTRMQNEDVTKLCELIKKWRAEHPNERIVYYRYNE